MLSGSVGFLQLRNRSFANGLTIDATNAHFTDTFQMKGVSGVNFIGGTFGSATDAMRYGQAVIIRYGSDISFTGANVIGNGAGSGINFTGMTDISVRDSTFTSLTRGLAFTSVTNGLMDSNRFLQSTSDGAAIVDSHFVTATNNLCSGTAPRAGAHPDCIQLWSLAGNPVQSDILIANNTALGATQGFTSFDPKRGGGLRITMVRNRVDTIYPQGIACYACVDSLIADNVLTTQDGAQWVTRMNIVGGGNNVVRNNSIGGLHDGSNAFGAAGLGVGSTLAEQMAAPIGASVPEPTVWLQLITGFAAIGTAVRRRQRLAGSAAPAVAPSIA